MPTQKSLQLILYLKEHLLALYYSNSWVFSIRNKVSFCGLELEMTFVVCDLLYLDMLSTSSLRCQRKT